MFPLWGKLKGGSTEVTSENSPHYYYHSNQGQILSADGAGYVIPDLGDYSPEKQVYVPKDAALEKIRQMMEEGKVVREAYEQNLRNVETFYKTAVADSKTHYETIITDLRQKAVRHVEVQREMRKKVEDKLTSEIQQNEKDIEDLRETLTMRKLEYQDEVRNLRGKINDTENVVKQLQVKIDSQDGRFAAEFTMAKIIHRLEQEEIDQVHDEQLKVMARDMVQQEQQIESDLQHERAVREEIVTALVQQEHDRHECRQVLEEVLHTLEIQDLRSHLLESEAQHQTITQLSTKLAELEATLGAKTAELARLNEHNEGLSSQGGEYAKQIATLHEEHELEIQRLHVEKDKALQHLKQKSNTILKQMKATRDRTEVELVVTQLKEQVLDRSLQAYLTSTADTASLAVISSGQQTQLILQHEQQLHAAEEHHKERVIKMKKDMKAVVDKLKAQNTRLVVQSVLGHMVNHVVDKDHLLQTPTFDFADLQAAAGGDGSIDTEKANLMQELARMQGQLQAAQLEIERARQASPRPQINQSQPLQPQQSQQGASMQRQQSQLPAQSLLVAGSQLPFDENADRRSQLKQQLQELNLQVSTKSKDITSLEEVLGPMRQERDTVKNEIKIWTKEFQDANGREPEVADKALIRDKYQKYKVVSIKSKELETKQAELVKARDELIVLRDQIAAELKAVPDPPVAPAPAPVAVVVAPPVVATTSSVKNNNAETTEAAVQVDTQELRGIAGVAGAPNMKRMVSTLVAPVAAATPPADGNAAATTTAASNDNSKEQLAAMQQQLEVFQQQHDDAMEQMEDQLYAVRDELSRITTEKNKLASDQTQLKLELDALIKEKRTDVIKRYEEEIETLRAAEIELKDKVATLTAEKVKLETRFKEFKERAERAEQELRDRDLREQAHLTAQDEKLKLSQEINKQREQVIMKSKAATAGWDAAASSDEKLEQEVNRAYQKGLKEEREKHQGDLKSIHLALEGKETRITELMVEIAEMQRRVKSVDEDKLAMNAQLEAMKLEVADAVQGLTQMMMTSGNSNANINSADGENTDFNIGPTAAEMDATREQLDLAQEELVNLMEKCEKMENDLDMARKKNRIYEKLATLTGLTSGKAASAAASASYNSHGHKNAASSSGGDQYDLEGAINHVKKAIVKGTNLWKSNRKDDCYDVYLEACQHAMLHLMSEDLVGPLHTSIDQGSKQDSKQKGAVFFRKGLDKFLNDAANPTIKAAEEHAVSALKTQENNAIVEQDSNNNGLVGDLMNQLGNIENTLLDQGYTKENNPTNTDSPRAEGEDNGNDGIKAASLLARAKAAEAQVASLKRQLAAVISATAASAAPAAASTSSTDAPASSTVAAGGAATTGGAVRASTSAANNNSADANRSASEIRRLTRKIKDLEAEIAKLNASGGGGGGGGGGGASSSEFKALQITEKQLQKKIKDMEAANKRDNKTLEMRASKAENALTKIQSTYNSVVDERDQLRNENGKLINATKEIAELRVRAEQCDALDAQLQAKDQELVSLQEAFKKETDLRKKYKNELEDLKGAVRVYARCRPMARYELERGCKQVVTIRDETSLKLMTSRGERDFEFDAVFSATSTQEQVFEDTKRLVESCLDGFNVCVFAYGQTGSGKTFTMTGAPGMPGLTPKAVEELYRLIGEKTHLRCKVTTYFVELYNDNLVDLYFVVDNEGNRGMQPDPPKLDIKLDAKKMVSIRNSVVKDANSPAELMDLFNRGNSKRHTGGTKMNAESSRSHSIFAIMVESYDTTTKRTNIGKLSLVDLAGSERQDKTGAEKERLKEAQSINKSLLALGDVIAALSEGNAKFIPYRNNKLTQLMQDSLGGNAKTLMFVNFSPADYNSDETYTSLQYAAKVKKIVNNASKQAESEEVAKLKAIIKRLQHGQPVADLIEDEGMVEPEPPMQEEEEGKVYDGY